MPKFKRRSVLIALAAVAPVSAAALLGAGIIPHMRGDGSVTNALSRLKAKLGAGESAVVFVNGDSTAYSDFGPFYKWASAVGDRHDATVILYRWAEWDVSAATGPKEYSAPNTLRTGSGPKLTVYLAALPGAVAGQMFSGSRKPKAIDAIPTPDLAIIHHGHNMASFSVPYAGKFGVGAGLFLGPIGMTSLQWPDTPQLITTQNPNRDDTTYTKKLLPAELMASAAVPGLTSVDTQAAFLAGGKAAELFRDNIHPSDSEVNCAGAQLISDSLFMAYTEAKADLKVSTVSWPNAGGGNVSISVSNPALITWGDHGLRAGSTVAFSTSGNLPVGLTPGTIYFVKNVIDARSFTVSASAAGAEVATTSAGKGRHTGAAGQLIENFDFGDWTGTNPIGWSPAGNVVLAKDTVNTYGGASHACSIAPNGDGSGQFQYIQKFLAQNSKELKLLAGKQVSIAALMKPSARQVRPIINVICNGESGAGRTWAIGDLIAAGGGWMWYVATGIVADNTAVGCYIRLVPAFQVDTPTVFEPLVVQRVCVSEGNMPKGMLAA